MKWAWRIVLVCIFSFLFAISFLTSLLIIDIHNYHNRTCLEELKVVDIIQISCESHTCEYLINTNMGKRVIFETPIINKSVCTLWDY